MANKPTEYEWNVFMRFPTDGPPSHCDEWMRLTELQKFVGGHIELVNTDTPGVRLIVNENDRNRTLPRNPHLGSDTQQLFGNVLVSKGKERKMKQPK